MDDLQKYKVVIVGAEGSGKTSIIDSYLQKKF